MLDWEAKEATCPQGKRSSSWRPTTTPGGAAAIQVHFKVANCGVCSVRVNSVFGSVTLHVEITGLGSDRPFHWHLYVKDWADAVGHGREVGCQDNAYVCDIELKPEESCPGCEVMYKVYLVSPGAPLEDLGAGENRPRVACSFGSM